MYHLFIHIDYYDHYLKQNPQMLRILHRIVHETFSLFIAKEISFLHYEISSSLPIVKILHKVQTLQKKIEKDKLLESLASQIIFIVLNHDKYWFSESYNKLKKHISFLPVTSSIWVPSHLETILKPFFMTESYQLLPWISIDYKQEDVMNREKPKQEDLDLKDWLASPYFSLSILTDNIYRYRERLLDIFQEDNILEVRILFHTHWHNYFMECLEHPYNSFAYATNSLDTTEMTFWQYGMKYLYQNKTEYANKKQWELFIRVVLKVIVSRSKQLGKKSFILLYFDDQKFLTQKYLQLGKYFSKLASELEIRSIYLAPESFNISSIEFDSSKNQEFPVDNFFCEDEPWNGGFFSYDNFSFFNSKEDINQNNSIEKICIYLAWADYSFNYKTIIDVLGGNEKILWEGVVNWLKHCNYLKECQSGSKYIISYPVPNHHQFDHSELSFLETKFQILIEYAWKQKKWEIVIQLLLHSHSLFYWLTKKRNKILLLLQYLLLDQSFQHIMLFLSFLDSALESEQSDNFSRDTKSFFKIIISWIELYFWLEKLDDSINIPYVESLANLSPKEYDCPSWFFFCDSIRNRTLSSLGLEKTNDEIKYLKENHKDEEQKLIQLHQAYNYLFFIKDHFIKNNYTQVRSQLAIARDLIIHNKGSLVYLYTEYYLAITYFMIGNYSKVLFSLSVMETLEKEHRSIQIQLMRLLLKARVEEVTGQYKKLTETLSTFKDLAYFFGHDELIESISYWQNLINSIEKKELQELPDKPNTILALFFLLLKNVHDENWGAIKELSDEIDKKAKNMKTVEFWQYFLSFTTINYYHDQIENFIFSEIQPYSLIVAYSNFLGLYAESVQDLTEKRMQKLEKYSEEILPQLTPILQAQIFYRLSHLAFLLSLQEKNRSFLIKAHGCLRQITDTMSDMKICQIFLAHNYWNKLILFSPYK